MTNLRFGIIGYGRFGRLWADVLKRFGEVRVYDEKEVSLADGLVDATIDHVVDVDYLFLLVPISTIGHVAETISSSLKKETVVVDAASVKCYPVAEMKEYFGVDQPIIATHPLFGPDSVARQGLAGQKCVLCPVRQSTEQLTIFRDLLHALELRVIECSPEEHDQSMARSQALVHFIGRGLESLELQSQDIATPDYNALLRMNAMVHNDTSQLFLDMQRYNPYAKIVRETFLRELESIESQIQSVRVDEDSSA